ncbi:hypothetical protein SAMN05421770_101859 [Granulicella rosea]|uniref:Uncharacterized protein n=1 Tax=Granulicella rosea TaxID=474952 RepID=A0A239EB10_9BACT|nr:hypothetical protein SAMN05421770_101859 [Granulicella rosea]
MVSGRSSIGKLDVRILAGNSRQSNRGFQLLSQKFGALCNPGKVLFRFHLAGCYSNFTA